MASTRRREEESEFACGICLREIEGPSNPVVTCCGHLFCWACIYRWMRQQQPATCPVCKGYLTNLQADFTPIYSLGSNDEAAAQSADRNGGAENITAPERPAGRRRGELNLQVFEAPEEAVQVNSRVRYIVLAPALNALMRLVTTTYQFADTDRMVENVQGSLQFLPLQHPLADTSSPSGAVRAAAAAAAAASASSNANDSANNQSLQDHIDNVLPANSNDSAGQTANLDPRLNNAGASTAQYSLSSISYILDAFLRRP
ncbi:hypothetical protein L7F22_061668 [Adiantum nelumboides]|nr:hypothetical protein [Adiantum nelumboides]